MSSSDDALRSGHAGHGHGTGKAGLVLAALGIVFGDIGTSPLYAFKECISGPHSVAATHEVVLGVLSLIVWSLVLVITVKYITFVTRANNHGEGGIFALLALVPPRIREKAEGAGVIPLLVLAGASLLYGDGMITPAISVLSAVEGIEHEAHAWQPYLAPVLRLLGDGESMKPLVVAITVVILFFLFFIQKRGTEKIGRLFGPVMVLWFATIGVLGAVHLAQNPAVLGAFDPRHAVRFFSDHGFKAFTVLGSVILAVTGGESLYADMGHFGRPPIRIAWLCVVFPALLLAYFGQGALVLAQPSASDNPFFAMVPRGAATYALVALATCATIIASQALISGAFSITRQAVQLGYLPRVEVRHTSRETEGQIYVPFINWLLASACIALVLSFKESSRLAAAYGIATAGTMTITSIVFFVVARSNWGWSSLKAGALVAFFLVIDLAFLSANFIKVKDGGWVPLAIGSVFFVCMLVWNRGRRILAALLKAKSRPLDTFMETTKLEARVSGTGVFMTSLSEGVPATLAHHAARVRVLHEKVVLLTIVTDRVPFVRGKARVEQEELPNGFRRVIGRFGFMESPNVPALLRLAKRHGLDIDVDDVTYFIGRETILALPGGRMGSLQESLFALLARNARHAGLYFKLPPDQVVEIGVQVDL